MSKYQDKLNTILKEYNTAIRISEYTTSEILLSNGLRITNASEIRRLKRRIVNKAAAHLALFDEIYDLDYHKRVVAERKAKSINSRKGGIHCQEQHYNKIKKNLNTGDPWNKGMKMPEGHSWNIGLTKDTDPRLKKMSEDRMGPGNPMYGKKHGDEYKQQQSIRMKNAILNGSFTPNTNNRNTHWNSSYDGKTYRSSWEALYAATDKTATMKN